MKQIGCICMLFVLIGSGQVAAQENDPKNGGFFGNILLGGGMAAGRPSKLYAVEGNEVITSLDGPAEHYSEAIPFIMAELGYVIESTGTQISLGTQSGRAGLLALAVNQSLDRFGSLGVILSYGCDEVWQDPYLVGVKRVETDETTTGLEFIYENIFDTGARLSISGTQIEIDDDQIGIREPDLNRDGTALSVGAGYVAALNEKNIIIPSIDFVVDDRDGKSNSSKGYRLSLEHLFSIAKFTFKTNLAFVEAEFDEIHPIFNQTREEKGYELSEFITYAEPFGWRRFSLNGLIAYSQMDTNISFFESDVLVVGLGVGYRF